MIKTLFTIFVLFSSLSLADTRMNGTVTMNGRITGNPTPAVAAPFSPTDIAGLEVWLKADGDVYNTGTTQATDGQTVATWVDASGNGNNATSIAAPTFETNVINGKPAIRWNGDKMEVANFSGVQPTTIFLVVSRTTDGAAMTYIDGLDQFTQLVYCTSPSGTLAMYAGSGIGGTGPDTGDWGVISANFNGGSSTAFLNGTSAIGAGNTGAGNAGGLTLGESGGGSFGYDGDIAEVLYYDSTLSEANRELVEDYLGEKYGITITN